MADLSRYMENLKTLDGGAFWASLSADQRAVLRQRAEKAVARGVSPREFTQLVTAQGMYTNWQSTQTPLPEAVAPTPGERLPGPPRDPSTPPPTGEDPTDADARDLIERFLVSWGLTGMTSFIETAVSEGWADDPDRLAFELRDTEEYKLAFPEQALRTSNGYTFMSEAQILAERDELKRLSREYLGIDLTGSEIANIIGKNKSPVEWEQTLKTWKDFERWGPTVRSVLEQELGYAIPDDRVFAFISTEISTPELDRAYERALMRGQPAVLGLGIRPEDEAELLRRYGISPEQAFRGYQGIVAELPRAERMAAIEAEINRNTGSFPTGTELFADTAFATVFRAVQLQDPDAILTLQRQLEREVARFQGQGGALQDRSGASVGLLAPDER